MYEHSTAVRDIVTFYRFIESAVLPTPADRAAGGSIPTRAFRYCEPLATANAYGWYVYPPMDLLFRWSYDRILWAYEGAETWMPLGAAQFPRQLASFDGVAPENCRGYSPPFLTAIREPGVVQIWSGFFARTAPGWSLHVRSPVNAPPSGSFRTYEGIIEADQWFGPLFINVQLTATGQTIEILKDDPLMQVQPLPRAAYSDRTLRAVSVKESLAELSKEDWSDFHRTIVAGPAAAPGPGRYAQAVRRRRRNEEPNGMAGSRAVLPASVDAP